MQFVDFPIGKWKKKSWPRAARDNFGPHIFLSNSVAFALKYTRSSPTNTSRIKARIQAQCLGHPMWLCARECPLRRPRTRRSLCRRPFRCNPLRRRPFRRRLPCCRLCRLCRRLAPCLCIYSPTARLAAAAASRSARLSAWLGSRLGSARLNRLGRHGLARLSTARHGSARLGTAGTAAAARMPAMPSWSALLGAAQLSSAQLGSFAQPRGSSGSARSARLARLRLTRFSARGGALLVAATCVRSTGQARRSRALAKIGPWAGRVRHCHSGTKGAGQGRVAYPTKSTLAERSRGVLRGENGRDGGRTCTFTRSPG